MPFTVVSPSPSPGIITRTYLRKYRRLYPVLCKIGRPKDFRRFIIQADACAGHNAYALLNRISCKTLVIGGSCDKIVSAAASAELAGAARGKYAVILPAQLEEKLEGNTALAQNILGRPFLIDFIMLYHISSFSEIN